MEQTEQVIEPQTLLKINAVITKLKINFPMISTPNPNIESQFEEDKMAEWVKQLKDLKLDATIRAIDELIRSRRQGQIDSLIKQPLVELRQMTYDMLEAIRAEENIKIEEKPVKVASPEYIEKLLKEAGLR